MSEDANTSAQGAASVQLTVPEMDCPSCAGKVDSSLGQVAGVVDTDLRPTTGTATVQYDADRVGRADIVAAIESAGYDVVGDDGGDEVAVAPPAEVWTSRRAITTWIGAGFLVAGLVVEFVVTGANPSVVTVAGYSLHLAELLLLAATAPHADSLRCGNNLIRPGDSVLEVTDACGRPDREVAIVDGDNDRVGTAFYYRLNNKADRKVYFRGGSVTDIERL